MLYVSRKTGVTNVDCAVSFPYTQGADWRRIDAVEANMVSRFARVGDATWLVWWSVVAP